MSESHSGSVAFASLGLHAAVIMGRMRSALRAYVLEAEEPAEELRRLDRKIQYFEPNAMATVLYGVLTPESGEFLVSSAGHLPPVIAVPGRRTTAPLGIEPDPPRALPKSQRRGVRRVL